YYYSLSSLLQAFLERSLPLTKAGLATTPSGLFRNKTRHTWGWEGKSIVFIAVAALRSMENFTPLQDTCRLIAEALDLKLGGVLVRPESHLTLFERSNPVDLKRVRAAFVAAGREVGRTGCISEDNLADASLYLSSTPDAFRQQSSVYWENAQSIGTGAMEIETCVAKVAGDPRLILQRMVASVNARATANVQAVIQFDFTDPELHVCVTIANGTATGFEKSSPNPTLRIRCQSRLWTEIAFGEQDAREAIARGDVELEGDRSLFVRLPRYFKVA
ncbi:MAG: hypothetical protein HN341_18450, partial [Verrucomicrobia bacterium]|nr:hypothetical protein [Verrucomicrobiota bacterium]